MPDNTDDPTATFWRQPATQWDVFKFFLPLVIACCLWAVRVEINQARNEARFEQIVITLRQQNDTLRDIQSTLKEFSTTRDERGQRLASIEAKIDILMAAKDRK
jgi:septal ring factor EnvC (AmiA/AmiB activator)